jgi:hypothetical protein
VIYITASFDTVDHAAALHTMANNRNFRVPGRIIVHLEAI